MATSYARAAAAPAVAAGSVMRVKKGRVLCQAEAWRGRQSVVLEHATMFGLLVAQDDRDGQVVATVAPVVAAALKFEKLANADPAVHPHWWTLHTYERKVIGSRQILGRVNEALPGADAA